MNQRSHQRRLIAPFYPPATHAAGGGFFGWRRAPSAARPPWGGLGGGGFPSPFEDLLSAAPSLVVAGQPGLPELIDALFHLGKRRRLVELGPKPGPQALDVLARLAPVGGGRQPHEGG